MSSDADSPGRPGSASASRTGSTTPKVMQRSSSARKILDLNVLTGSGSGSNSGTTTPVQGRPVLNGDSSQNASPRPLPYTRAESSDLFEFLDHLQIGKAVGNSGNDSPPVNYEKGRTYSTASYASMPSSPLDDGMNSVLPDSLLESPMRHMNYGSPDRNNSYMASPMQLYSPAPGRYINPSHIYGYQSGSSLVDGTTTPTHRSGVPIPMGGTPRARSISALHSSSLLRESVPESPVHYKEMHIPPPSQAEHPDPVKLPEDEQGRLRDTVEALHAHPGGESSRPFVLSGATFKPSAVHNNAAAAPRSGPMQFQMMQGTPITTSPLLNKTSGSPPQSREVADLKERLEGEFRWREHAQVEIQRLCEQIEAERAERIRLQGVVEEMRARNVEGRVRIEQTVTGLETKLHMEASKAEATESVLQRTINTHQSEKALLEDRLRKTIEDLEGANRRHAGEVAAHAALKTQHENKVAQIQNTNRCLEESNAANRELVEAKQELLGKVANLEVDQAAAAAHTKEMEAHVHSLRDRETLHLRMIAELQKSMADKDHDSESTVRAVADQIQKTAEEQIGILHERLQAERERNTVLEHKLIQYEVLAEENRRLRRDMGLPAPASPLRLKPTSASPGGGVLTPEQEDVINRFSRTLSQ